MSVAVTAPGSLKCQQNSFLKVLKSNVVSCTKSKTSVVINKKTGKKKQDSQEKFDLVLDDTILFPEGGGQPCDHGTVADLPVENVLIENGKCIHHVNKFLSPGTEVDVVVEWSRRFDHMQQHSAQHLISAVAFNNWGLKTTSWDLGFNKCSVEFATSTFSQEQLMELEELVNQKIIEALPVTIGYKEDMEVEKGEMEKKLRYISIGDIDESACCGTHVQNTSQLQSVKFLNTEFSCGCVRLHFLAGSRVLRDFEQRLQREASITKVLSCGPGQFVDRIDKILISQRQLSKEVKALRQELTDKIVASVKEDIQHQKHTTKKEKRVIHIHQDSGDASFLKCMPTAFEDYKAEKIFLCTIGDRNGQGMFLLFGPESILSEVKTQVSELFGGRGGGIKGRFQGKATTLRNIDDVKILLEESAAKKDGCFE